jgi:predicted RNA-binding protein
MCLANIYQNSTAGKPLIRSVAYLKIDGNRIVTENLTGETEVMQARIKEIDFMNSDIFVEQLKPESERKGSSSRHGL